MDSPLMPCPAALAGIAVADEDGIAVAAEAPARVRDLPVAAAAEPGNRRVRPAKAAEQARLGGFQQRISIAEEKRHYRE